MNKGSRSVTDNWTQNINEVVEEKNENVTLSKENISECFVSMDSGRKDQDSDTPLLLQLIIHKHGTVHTQFVAEAARLTKLKEEKS